jgi:hypothetical protein
LFLLNNLVFLHLRKSAAFAGIFIKS